MLMINLLKAPILKKTIVEEEKSVTFVDTKVEVALVYFTVCVFKFCFPFFFQSALLEPFSKILSTCISKYKFSSELLYELCEVSYNLHLKVTNYLSNCHVFGLVVKIKFLR